MKNLSKSFILNFINFWLCVILLQAVFMSIAVMFHEFSASQKLNISVFSVLAMLLAIVTGSLLRKAILQPFLVETENINRENYLSGIKELKANSWKGYILIILGIVFYFADYVLEFSRGIESRKSNYDVSSGLLGFIFIIMGAVIQLRYFIRGALQGNKIVKE